MALSPAKYTLVCTLLALLCCAGCTIQPGEKVEVGFGGPLGDEQPLSVAVLEALQARADIDASTIEVRSNGDVVTLLGRVHSTGERDSAERAAERVPGVKAVVNSLFVPSS